MKYLTSMSSVMLLFSTSIAIAQTPAGENAGHHPEETLPRATDESHGTKSDPAITPRMNDNMRWVQDLMARIHASKNRAERQRLLQQHSTAMHDQMDMMRDMAGARNGMAGGGMEMGEGMMKKMMTNHQAMQGRMRMMEMIMGQMLEHQEAQQSATPAK